jgi:hypothetical protein
MDAAAAVVPVLDRRGPDIDFAEAVREQLVGASRPDPVVALGNLVEHTTPRSRRSGPATAPTCRNGQDPTTQRRTPAAADRELTFTTALCATPAGIRVPGTPRLWAQPRGVAWSISVGGPAA